MKRSFVDYLADSSVCSRTKCEPPQSQRVSEQPALPGAGTTSLTDALSEVI